MAKKKAGKAPKAAKGGNLPSPSLPGHKSPGNGVVGNKGFAKMGKGKKDAC